MLMIGKRMSQWDVQADRQDEGEWGMVRVTYDIGSARQVLRIACLSKTPGA